MGWKIETNNIDKWEVISSVVDDVIATFSDEQSLKIWLAKDRIYEGKKKAIEILMEYPNQWTVNNERTFGKKNEYYTWVDSLHVFDTYEKYYIAIDEKLEELGVR